MEIPLFKKPETINGYQSPCMVFKTARKDYLHPIPSPLTNSALEEHIQPPNR